MPTSLEILTQEYEELCKNFIDIARHHLYLISHHSTAIEGSTLTALETEIFLDKGLTAKGKPLEHHLMVKDHYAALGFITKSATEKKKIDTKFIQSINAAVMHSTGTIYNTALGSFDASKGDLRLLNVRAGMTGESDMNYDKVPLYLKKLCEDLKEKINTVKTLEEINELAFLAHYQLVTIHPFDDGNGRTSRLLMNYIQSYHKKPLSIVFSEDRQAYIESLIATREQEDIQVFLEFMHIQHLKYLQEEIKRLNTKQEPKHKNIKRFNLVF